MSGAFQFAYGDPSNYSDWASYAGLDRKTGMFAASAPDTGVPPPNTVEELWQQKAVAPAEKALGSIKNTANIFTNTAKQMGQGNVVGAYNAARGVVPVTPTPTTTQPALTTQPAPDWNLQSHID